MPVEYSNLPKRFSYLMVLLPLLTVSPSPAQTPDGPVICRNGIVQVVSPDKVTASQCRSAAKEVIAVWNFDFETMHWTAPERLDQPITLRLLSDERMDPGVRASANPNGRFTVRLSLIDDPSLLSTFAHELGHIQADRTMGPNRRSVPDYYFEGHGLLMNWLYAEHVGRRLTSGPAQAKTLMTLTPDAAQKILTDPDYGQKHITSMERLGLFFVEYLRVRQNAPDAVTSIRKVFEQAFSKIYGLRLTRAIQDVVDLIQQTQAHPADRLKGTCFEQYVSE